MELHRHGLDRERALEPGLIALADAAGLPLVATNDCFFASPDMHEAHDALLAIAEGRLLSERDRRRVTPEHWFKPAPDMRVLFADLPEACDNTLAIARRCAVMMETRKPLLPVSPKVHAGSTEEETVRAMAIEGLDRRMDAMAADAGTRARYRERLDYELSVIISMGFAGYFLIVADFIQWAKAQAIPVGPGRGSGAGSVAAWALTITDLDPIRFDLLFERFLNPERVSMPDFDIDFCQEGRDAVIDYVRREYGGDRVAQIITFGKLQARAAVRDVGRVLGLPFGQVNKVAELIPNIPAAPVTLQQAIDREPRLQAMRDRGRRHRATVGNRVADRGPVPSRQHARRRRGDRRPATDRTGAAVPRSALRFPGDAVFDEICRAGWPGEVRLPRPDDAHHPEARREPAARSRHRGGCDRLPLDDPKTYEMLRERRCRRRVPDGRPGHARHAAPDAPGPVRGPGRRGRAVSPRADGQHPRVLPAQARRERRRRRIRSIHAILAETYGIIVYQEQVMQIAQTMAGYSLGGADLLRRAMGKKIPAEMEAQRDIFTKGAIARGIDPEKAKEVFDLMAKFAGYGFNKCHAAPYGLLAYQTAWLKANHPEVFIAACMSLALGNTDRLAALREEATRSGIRILPPDINRSGADFTVERTDDGSLAIRYALAAVKKVGFAAMQALTEARGDTPFADLADFAARVDPRQLNRMQLENLVRAGAFDALEPNRARHFAAAEAILRRAQADGGGEGQRSDRPVRRIARHITRGAASAGDAGLAADGAPRLRSRGDRLPPHRASARRLRQGAAPARHDGVCAGRGKSPTPASRACAWRAWWRHRRSG